MLGNLFLVIEYCVYHVNVSLDSSLVGSMWLKPMSNHTISVILALVASVNLA